MIKQTQNQTKSIGIIEEIGNLPPQATELEAAVLGILLLEKDALSEIGSILTTDHFYKEENQKIFSAILDLYNKDKAIDILTVAEYLKKTGELEEIGGNHYLANLTKQVTASIHIEFHSKIITQKFIQRGLIEIANELIKESYQDSKDVEDLINTAETKLLEISEINIKKETQKVDIIIDETIEKLKEISKKEGQLIGLPSGFTKLDRITSGWQESDLIIIAARPSMGKTAFALSMANEMAKEHGVRTAFFSLEMSATQLVQRLILAETKIDSEKLKNGRLSDEEWEEVAMKTEKMSNAPLYIDDTSSISIFELRSKVRKLKLKNDIQIVMIDYLQLMVAAPDNSSKLRGNREQEVSMISRSLKALAKDLSIPIIALSQLNRGVESRHDKIPMLSDLRESGAIEQDADIVMLLHRPEYHKITQDDNGNDLRGVAQVIIAKHRNGPTDTVNMKFIQEYAKFEDDLNSNDPYDDDFDINTIKSSKMNDEEMENDEFNNTDETQVQF